MLSFMCKNMFMIAVFLSALLGFSQSVLVAVDRRQSNSLATSSSPLSRFVVPLSGRYETLPAPSPDSQLVYLTLARGIIHYNCSGRKAFQTPRYTSQATSLWDAAPLLSRIANEEEFHAIIPQLYEFDYTEIANTTLTCIGNVNTVDGQPIVELFGNGRFPINVQQTVQAPERSAFNLDWAYEVSNDRTWQIYRVETVAGKPPRICAEQAADIAVTYAAEYWFYQT